MMLMILFNMNRKRVLIPVIFLTVIIIILVIVLGHKTRYNRISVSQSKWDSIISSRSEDDKLVLEDIEFNDYNVVIDERSNTLYYSLVNASKSKYNPNIKFSASDENAKMAILSDEITDEKVKNGHKFKIIIYNSKKYHVYDLICTDLPILSVTYMDKGSEKQKSVPVEIYLFDNLSDLPNKVVKSRGKFRSDDGFYELTLNMMTPGRNIRENRVTILGMRPESGYMLTKTDDELVDDLDRNREEHRVALFVNGEFKGIYNVENEESNGEV